jgi:hypothetical protein
MRLMREKGAYIKKGVGYNQAFRHPNIARNSIALDSLGPEYTSFDNAGPSYTLSDNILNSITNYQKDKDAFQSSGSKI